MKKIQTLTIFCLISISFVNIMDAQKMMFGAEIGIGKSDYDFLYTRVVWPFDDYFTQNVRVGFAYYYSINKSLWLNSGIGYNNRHDTNRNFSFLNLPVGIEFESRNKIAFLAGMGLNLSYSLSRSFNYISDPDDRYKNLQLEWFANLGAGIRFSDHFQMRLVYQNNFNITPYEIVSQHSPGGIPYFIKDRIYDGYFKIIVLSSLSGKETSLNSND